MLEFNFLTYIFSQIACIVDSDLNEYFPTSNIQYLISITAYLSMQNLQFSQTKTNPFFSVISICSSSTKLSLISENIQFIVQVWVNNFFFL